MPWGRCSLRENLLIELGNWILSLKTSEILCVVLTARLLDRAGTLLTIRGATVSNSSAAAGSGRSKHPHPPFNTRSSFNSSAAALHYKFEANAWSQKCGSHGTFPKIIDRSEDSDTHSSVYPND